MIPKQAFLVFCLSFSAAALASALVGLHYRDEMPIVVPGQATTQGAGWKICAFPGNDPCVTTCHPGGDSGGYIHFPPNGHRGCVGPGCDNVQCVGGVYTDSVCHDYEWPAYNNTTQCQ